MSRESGKLAADAAQRASALPQGHIEEGPGAPDAISEPMAVVHLPSDAFAVAGDWGPDSGAGQDTRAEVDVLSEHPGFRSVAADASL